MNDLRRCMLEIDVAGARAAWAKISPHLLQPRSDDEALAMIHCARTAARSIPLRLRAYSHRWLTDRELPSRLPDELRPRAERMYPRVVGAVGISVNTGSELFRPVMPLVQSAMSDAVLECYADGHQEPEIVKPRMMEARRATVRKLLGIRG